MFTQPEEMERNRSRQRGPSRNDLPRTGMYRRPSLPPWFLPCLMATMSFRPCYLISHGRILTRWISVHRIGTYCSTSFNNDRSTRRRTTRHALAELAAIDVTDAVMKSILFHSASQMTVVNTPSEAPDLYRRASRIPSSATEISLRENNIAVANIFPGTDTSKSIILEAFEDGSPCLLKITDTQNIDHEMRVWEAISQVTPRDGLVPLKRLDFTKAAIVHRGILMEKYPTTLSRCKIPLTAEVLLRYGTQLREAISILHNCGFCHMDIKPANVFLSARAKYFLGDYGGPTGVGEPVREHTMSYYPTDAGHDAKKETDFLLLIVTLLEIFGSIPSPPNPMSIDEIKSKVADVEKEDVKTYLNELLLLASIV